jgi:hypothetical protein
MKDKDLIDGINQASLDHADAVEVANETYNTTVGNLKGQYEAEYDSEGGHTAEEEAAYNLHRDAVKSTDAVKASMPDADPLIFTNMDTFVNETWNNFYQILQ